jgi:hypothetical protein
MIAEVLNRDFVLQQLDELRDDLEASSRSLEEDTLFAVLSEAAERERTRSSGQTGFELPAAERRGQDPAPLDDFAFFSHDPIVNLLQSALDEYFDEHPEDLREEPPEDDERRGAGGVATVTDRSLLQPPRRRDDDNRRVFDKFSIGDVRWVRSKLAEGIRAMRGRRGFNMEPAPPCPIDDRCRVVLVGDWATGVPRARDVARAMRHEIDEGQRAGIEQHVIHLGDVYYSGWPHEVRRRFLKHWPVDETEAAAIGSWALNANHDMYSGGYGYFDTLLADPRFALQKGSSFFSLANERWKILGLDTAWEDGALCAPQPAWLDEETRGRSKKVILLSHHQLFSAYDRVSEALGDAVFPILGQQPATAWFWGHEHRCVSFKPTDSVTYPRCLGHGGVPVYMNHGLDDAYPPSVEFEYRESHETLFERWALFGFAVLDFDGATLNVRYIDESGRVHRSERIA